MISSEPAPTRPAWQRDPLLDGGQSGFGRGVFRVGALPDTPARAFRPAPDPRALSGGAVGATHEDMGQPDSGAADAAPTEMSASTPVAQAVEDHQPAQPAAQQALERAHANGYRAGEKAGFDAGHAEGLRAGRSAGFDAGREAGLAEARTEMAALEAERRQLRDLCAGIAASAADPRSLYRSLELLALHLALQLVRAELTFSGSAIRQLVEKSLDQLDGQQNGLTIRLHPQDAELLLQAWGSEPAMIEVLQDAALARGSVIVEAMGAVVEDLIENRLADLCAGLLGDAAAVTLPAGFAGVPDGASPVTTVQPTTPVPPFVGAGSLAVGEAAVSKIASPGVLPAPDASQHG